MKSGHFVVIIIAFAFGALAGAGLKGGGGDLNLDSDTTAAPVNGGADLEQLREALKKEQTANRALESELLSARDALTVAKRELAQSREAAEVVTPANPAVAEGSPREGRGTNNGGPGGGWGERMRESEERRKAYAALSPDERAAKIAETRTTFDNAVSSRNKDAVLAALRELRDLGSDAYPELAQALNQVYLDRKNGDTLDIDGRDLWGMTGGDPELQKLLMNDTSLEQDLRMSALWSSGWRADEEELAPFISSYRNILATESDMRMQTTAAQMLARAGDAQAVPAIRNLLSSVTDNEAYRDLMFSLSRMDSNEAVDTISYYAQYANTEEQRETAAFVLSSARPPADGYWLTSVESSGAAAKANLKRGDIIVSYNNKTVTGEGDIRGMTRGTTSSEQVAVQFYRNNVLQSTVVSGGELGVRGDTVRKK